MFWEIIRKILKCPDCEKYKKEIESLQNQLNDYKGQVNILEDKYNRLHSSNLMCQQSIKEKLEIIKELRKQLSSIGDWEHDNSEPPEWLRNDWTSYKGVRTIHEKSGIVTVRINTKDLYYPRPSLIKLVAVNKWGTLPHDERIIEIWKYVIKQIHYRYDKSENWQEPNITNDLGYGDCEDGTILFLTLCRIAGIRANEIFNALGYFYTRDGNRFGHSFPIARLVDGNWYIFETTIDFYPSKLMKFKGSNYSADWGVHNWKFDGKIKNSSIVNGREVYQV